MCKRSFGLWCVLFLLASFLPVCAFAQTITVTNPEAGATWAIGTTQVIHYTVSGATTGSLSIEINRSFPLDSGWVRIGEARVPSENFTWTVTGPVNHTSRIRVVLVNTTVVGLSPGNFSITESPTNPTLTITAPVGGERWAIGTTQRIGWRATNLTGNVTIRMLRLNGTDTLWTELGHAVLPSDGFNWVVAGPASERARIYLTAGNLTAVSNLFAIVSNALPSITVNAPNGGERWLVGSTQRITWTAVNLTGSVLIELNRSFPGDSMWTTIGQATLPSDGFSWVVTGPITTTARIRVRVANSSASYSDISNENFAIYTENPAPVVRVTSPNGGERWAIGSTQHITWTAPNMTGTAIIRLLRFNGTDSLWTELGRVTLPSEGFAWIVTGPASERALISVTVGNVSDVSDGTFSIVSVAFPSITVNAPNGGERWLVGSTQRISFTAVNLTGLVQIELNRNFPNDSMWVPLGHVALPSDGFSWVVTDPVTTTARIRVRSLNTSAIYSDISNENFAIYTEEPPPQLITVISPNGGERWQVGSTQQITWSTRNYTGPITILLNRNFPGDSNWITIGQITGNVQSFSWTVTDPISERCRIRLVSPTLPPFPVEDISNANFSIVAPETTGMTILSPNGGERWAIGTTQCVTWVSRNYGGAVTIELNRNFPSDSMWEVIGQVNTATIGRFEWIVTGHVSEQCRIRLTTPVVPPFAVDDISDHNFAIVNGDVHPSIVVGAPNGGERWIIGSSQRISWRATGLVGDVSIQINRHFPLDSMWEFIGTATLPSDGFTWIVSGPVTSTARIMVRAMNYNVDYSDISNENFGIAENNPTPITVLTPNGGEVWNVGTEQRITYTTANLSGSVTIQLNRNFPSETDWETLGQSTIERGVYVWRVIGPVSRTCRIRVMNTVGHDISDNNFGIVEEIPSIVVTAPNGGERWQIGSSQRISWHASAGLVGGVSIQLSRHFPSDSVWEILGTTPSGDGFTWVVTGPVTTTARIRVRAMNYNVDYFDISNENFSIISADTTRMRVVRPNGYEVWTIGSDQRITWASHLTAGTAVISLNRNFPGDSGWVILGHAVLPSDGFTWHVTGPITERARIRVMVERIGDVSDANFRIVESHPVPGPRIVVTSPAGGDAWAIGSQHAITWQTEGVTGDVVVQLNRSVELPRLGSSGIASTGNPSSNPPSPNPVAGWETIGTAAVTAHQMNWEVTGPISTTCMIRILSRTNSTTISGMTVDNFSIVGSRPIDAPIVDNGDAISIHPNPFNASTTISYTLLTSGSVRLAVFDIMGHEVATFANGIQESGIHSVNFNGSHLPSGMYFVSLRAANQNTIKKVYLLK